MVLSHGIKAVVYDVNNIALRESILYTTLYTYNLIDIYRTLSTNKVDTYAVCYITAKHIMVFIVI